MDGESRYDSKEFSEVFTDEQLERIRDEFSRLKGTCYLDHAGGALYPRTLLDRSFNDLRDGVYGNPHSGSTVSRHCSDTVDQARFRVLQHFNADPDEYSVIFTSGATQALQLVAESFCFTDKKGGQSGHFVYLEDNHTSVLGMRDVVSDRGASVACLDHETACELFTRAPVVEKEEEENVLTNSLFVYSAQCNFSGVKFPLNWIQRVHNRVLERICHKRSRWFCLLDAASFASTNPLDLTQVKPDFLCISFYKLFGYPTGLGALLVRKTSEGVLSKKYYGGGTVLMVLSMRSFHVPRPVLHDRFEDGTINFLAISSLNQAFPLLYELVGSMDNISRHSFGLASYTFYKLLKLHHSNGRPAVRLYADSAYDDIRTQGNVVNFNLLRCNGEYVGFAEVLHMANLHGIQLRTGCFCNQGACKRHLGLTVDDIMRHFEAGHVCGDDRDLVDGQPTGSVRVSFGLYNTRLDADRLLETLETCFVTGPKIVRTPAHWQSARVRLKSKFEVIESSELEDEALVRVDGRIVDTPIFEMHGIHVPTSVNFRRHQEIHLSHIFVYPIKSCGRFEVSEWDLGSKGLLYDRQWMITNASGVALTQKHEPKLSIIRPVINLTTGTLDLSFEGMNSISIPINQIASSGHCNSKVCGDRIRGFDCGDDVAQWLSSVLNLPGLRLIKQSAAKDSRSSNKQGTRGALSLANQAQYLMINATSVKWLSDQLDEHSDCNKESMIERFRSNFVVSGLDEAFVEQSWASVVIGSVRFSVDGPCSRCQMICIDQNTGEKAKDPLTLLSVAQKGKLKFGIYLSKVTNGDVRIWVGDKVSFVYNS